MNDVLANWDGSFVASLFAGSVVPLLLGGVCVVGLFWLVGYLVDHLFRWMQ